MTDAEFGEAALQTGLYVLLFVPASVLAGLFLAVALNRSIRFIGFYRTAIFVPFVASAAATGILSTYLFSPQFGLANNVLRRARACPQQGWLEDPHQAMLVIAIMSLWGQAAFTTVIYLAALQDIPVELIEAARIDGANPLAGVLADRAGPSSAPVTVFVDGLADDRRDAAVRPRLHDDARRPLDSTKTIVYFLWEKAFRASSSATDRRRPTCCSRSRC